MKLKVGAMMDDAHQSMRRLIFFTSIFMRSSSSRMKFAKYSGFPPADSAPSALKAVLKSSFIKKESMPWLILSTIRCGVPAGAKIPYHEFARYPGKPDSAMVGKSGNALLLFKPVLPSTFKRPVATCGKMATLLENINLTWPDSRSANAGARPLYGTCVI